MSASLAPECSEKKEKYDTCFINWYSEQYLRGKTAPSKACEELFVEYRDCLNAALKKKGIYDMIEEARKADTGGAGSATGGGNR